jgi:hypothetical protein
MTYAPAIATITLEQPMRFRARLVDGRTVLTRVIPNADGSETEWVPPEPRLTFAGTWTLTIDRSRVSGT